MYPAAQLAERLSELALRHQLPKRLELGAAERLQPLLHRRACGMLPCAGQLQILPKSGLGLLLIYYQPAATSWSLEVFDLTRGTDRLGHLFLDGEQRYAEPPNPERRMKIVDFVVNGTHRSQGIGSWMLHTSLVLGQQSGVRTIWGEVVSTDEVGRLIPYYIRNGFEAHLTTNPDAHVRAIISLQL